MRLVLYTALSKGGNSHAMAACNPADRSGNHSALRRTTTMDPRARAILDEAPSFLLSATYSVHLEFRRIVHHDRPYFPAAVPTRSFRTSAPGA
jgi:hypothetical protein